MIRYCDRTLHALLLTFLDIIRLRKGPEQVPDSVLVLLVSIGLLLFSTFCSSILISTDTGGDVMLSLLASISGYLFYSLILAATGRLRRFTPTISSIMACGSILSIFMVLAIVMFRPFLGNQFAWVIAELILFWSVPVKGHIIARAIDRHWYAGIAIAMTIFLLQFVIYSSLTRQN